MDGKVDVIFENIGSPDCKDHKKKDAYKIKSERNSVDALLHRFQRNGPMDIARDYQVIFVLVCGKSLVLLFICSFVYHVFGMMSCDLTSSAAVQEKT